VNGITLVEGLRRIRWPWLWQQRDRIRLGSRDAIASNVAMVMTHRRHPLLSRRLLATRYLKAQKNLHHSNLYNPLILPSLETRLGVDVLYGLPEGVIVLPSPLHLEASWSSVSVYWPHRLLRE
jgi:hypothetical protein